MVGNLGTELPTGSDRKETRIAVIDEILQLRPQSFTIARNTAFPLKVLLNQA
jgi:hypothetical protein